MVYDTKQNVVRGAKLRRTIMIGTWLILTVVGLSLFKTEFERILSLPKQLNNYLYLGLLTATGLLTAGWIFVADKEFDIMCEFLDPRDYSVPDETVTGVAIAVTLVVLLYTARNPIWFGVSYSLYACVSIYGWSRLKVEMDRATLKTKEQEISEEPFISNALDLLNSYYVRQPNVPRVVGCFVLGLAGLICSIIGSSKENVFTNVAYVLYIVSIVVLEGGLAFYWRWRLYSSIRPFQVAKYEFERAKARV